jgi:hypothetical protein
VKAFPSLRDTLISLQAVSPAGIESGLFARLPHATALASCLPHYAGTWIPALSKALIDNTALRSERKAM